MDYTKYLGSALNNFSSLSNTVSSAFGYNKPTAQEKVLTANCCYLCLQEIVESKVPIPILECKHKFCEACWMALSDSKFASYVKSIVCPKCRIQTKFEDSQMMSSLIQSQMPDLSQSFVDIPLELRRKKASNEARSLKNSQEDEFVVLEEALFEIEPAYCIPFHASLDECPSILKRWIADMWMVPYDLDEKMIIQDFSQRFIPFYLFEVTTITSFTVQVGQNTRDPIEWNEVKDSLSSHTYRNLIASASFSLGQEHSPLVLQLVQENGALTEEKFTAPPESDIPQMRVETDFVDAFRDQVLPQVQERETQECQNELSKKYSKTRNLNPKTQLESFSYSIVLVPMFLGSFKYLEKWYYVAINGNNRQIRGTCPTGSGRLFKYCKDFYQSAQQTVNNS